MIAIIDCNIFILTRELYMIDKRVRLIACVKFDFGHAG